MDILGLSVFFSILLLQFVVMESHLNKEPQITCVSEFDYDYRTLQKVLETEHSHKDLEKTVATQQQMIKDLNEKISSIEQPIQASVAFTAVVSPGMLENLGPGQTIIFDRDITNIGQAYNSQSGVFTAPIGGIYVFNMAIMVRPGDREYTEFVKNGRRVMPNYPKASGATDYVSSSRIVSLQLATGDQVWIRTTTTSFHGNGRIHGNEYSTFSGWLVTVGR